MTAHTPDPSATPADRSGSRNPGSSQGMPDKTPAPGRDRAGKAETPADAADEANLAMPHERDQAIDKTPQTPDPQVKQASTDVGRGLKDTGKGPAMDAAYDKLKRR